LFDKDGGGTIDARELGAVMNSLGQHPTDAELRCMISQVDRDMNGEIEFGEFLAMMAHMLHGAGPDEELHQAFEEFDLDKNGYISAIELRCVMGKLAEEMTEAEIDEVVREADVDGDGQVNYNEFIKMVRSKC